VIDNDSWIPFAGEVGLPEQAPAVCAPDRIWTYGDLARTSSNSARQLRAAGHQRDDLIGVLARRDASGIIGFLSAVRAGCVPLVLDPGLPRKRIQEMIADSGSSHVLGNVADLERLDLRSAGITLPTKPAERSAAVPWRRRAGDDPAYLVYTSGTTGVPKGVMTSWAGVRNITREQRRILDLNRSARVFQMSPVSFDAFIFEMLMAFGSGGTLVLPAGIGGPGKIADRVREESVTHLVATPTMLAALPSENLPSLKVVCSVGERCSRSVVARWKPGRRLFNLYGPAEATIWATWTEMDVDSDPSCIGKTISGVSALIADRDLNPVPRGSAGQIFLTGPNIALGYHARPRLTAERFVPGPHGSRLYATGDIVTEDADGNLRFVGRSDRQIKVQGARVEPGEIEETILRIPGVLHAFVTSVMHEQTGQQTLGAVYGPTGSAPGPGVVRKALAAALPRWMVPQILVSHDQIPMAAGGKADEVAIAGILARALAPRDSPGASGVAAPDQPAGTRRPLIELASVLLGRQDISPEDNFLACGGNSLLGMRLLADIEYAFGVTLPLDHLFSAGSFLDLESEIEAAAPSRSRGHEPSPRKPATSYPPSAAQLEMLAAEALLGGSAAFLQPWCERVRGLFDPGLFAAAAARTVARHEVMRTRYRAGSGNGQASMTAMVDSVPDVHVIHLDASDTGSTGLEKALTLTTKECAIPIRLDERQPVKLLTIRIDDDDHLVTLIVHHVACDATSFKIFLDELWDRYNESSRRKPAGKRVIPSYSGFAAWQADFIESQTAARQRRWWARQLAGVRPVHLGVVGRAAGPRMGRRLAFTLPPDVSACLSRTCAELRITPYCALSAAFTIAIEPYIGGQECVVGTPCDIRGREFADTVGIFINMVPVRLRLPERGTARTWLLDWQRECAAAFANGLLPYKEISGAWPGYAHAGQLPVVFAVSYTDVGDHAPGNILRERVQLDSGPVKGELIFTLTKQRADWRGEVIYDSSILDDAQGAEILDRFMNGLRSITNDPLRDVRSICPGVRWHIANMTDLEFKLDA
jgi:amino acid adenylation domain-containing protein